MSATAMKPSVSSPKLVRKLSFWCRGRTPKWVAWWLSSFLSCYSSHRSRAFLIGARVHYARGVWPNRAPSLSRGCYRRPESSAWCWTPFLSSSITRRLGGSARCAVAGLPLPRHWRWVQYRWGRRRLWRDSSKYAAKMSPIMRLLTSSNDRMT